MDVNAQLWTVSLLALALTWYLHSFACAETNPPTTFTDEISLRQKSRIFCIFLFSKKKSLTDSRLLAYASTICVCDFWRDQLFNGVILGPTQKPPPLHTFGMGCVCLEHASSNTFGFNSRIHCTRLSASLHFSHKYLRSKNSLTSPGEQCRLVTHQDMWSCAYHAWLVIP